MAGSNGEHFLPFLVFLRSRYVAPGTRHSTRLGLAMDAMASPLPPPPRLSTPFQPTRTVALHGARGSWSELGEPGLLSLGHMRLLLRLLFRVSVHVLRSLLLFRYSVTHPCAVPAP